MKIPIVLAINDPQNGQPTGYIDTLRIEDVINLEGDEVPCRFVHDSLLEIDGLYCVVYQHGSWVGNWCWDSCYIDSRNLAVIISSLRNHHWACTEANQLLFRAYTDGQPIYPDLIERLYLGQTSLLDRIQSRWLDLKEWWQQSAFERYLRQQVYRRQAKHWLKANNDVAIACRLMFNLNRWLRQQRYSPRRRQIYQLKNLLAEYLYKKGYCQSSTIQKQELECWSCGGTGEYRSNEDCYKCDGTGIYRTHYLYKFTFQVAGQRYIWHQPKPLVGWAVVLSWDGESKYQQPPSTDQPNLASAIIDLYLVTLYEFLTSKGIEDLPRLLTFSKVAQEMSRSWQWKLESKYGKIKRWIVKMISVLGDSYGKE